MAQSKIINLILYIMVTNLSSGIVEIEGYDANQIEQFWNNIFKKKI